MEFNYSDEQKMFRDTVYRFARKELVPLSEESDLKGEFNFEIWRKMGEMGLLGISVPEKYGGQGADIITCCLAGEALGHAGVDGGHTLAWSAHIYLCAATINQHGTEEQKQKYLPKLATGEWIGCMGLTEPGCGSDAAALATTAVKKGDKYILNGSKTFITNAPLAQVFVIFATLDKTKKHKGITAFIVEKDYPGISTGNPMHKMGYRSSKTSEVFMENCEVPAENCLGGEGAGWPIALGGVEWDRCTVLAPGLGTTMFMLENCARYANERYAFGRPIGEFQSIQNRIADMRVYEEAAKLCIYRVAASKDKGINLNPLLASVNKMYVGDKGFEMCSAGVDLYGGYGYIHEYPVERALRDAKLMQLGGGTSDIMRMIVARFLMM
ncbi:MAG: acyl-CoA dehydrogenase family protein [Deltaproteobacteria bacterium]|nr:acyl-CoA dehydrogenase family protein [Deltaproteobacteria bacterium]